MKIFLKIVVILLFCIIVQACESIPDFLVKPLINSISEDPADYPNVPIPDPQPTTTNIKTDNSDTVFLELISNNEKNENLNPIIEQESKPIATDSENITPPVAIIEDSNENLETIQTPSTDEILISDLSNIPEKIDSAENFVSQSSTSSADKEEFVKGLQGSSAVLSGSQLLLEIEDLSEVEKLDVPQQNVVLSNPQAESSLDTADEITSSKSSQELPSKQNQTNITMTTTSTAESQESTLIMPELSGSVGKNNSLRKFNMYLLIVLILVICLIISLFIFTKSTPGKEGKKEDGDSDSVSDLDTAIPEVNLTQSHSLNTEETDEPILTEKDTRLDNLNDVNDEKLPEEKDESDSLEEISNPEEPDNAIGDITDILTLSDKEKTVSIIVNPELSDVNPELVITYDNIYYSVEKITTNETHLYNNQILHLSLFFAELLKTYEGLRGSVDSKQNDLIRTLVLELFDLPNAIKEIFNNCYELHDKGVFNKKWLNARYADFITEEMVPCFVEMILMCEAVKGYLTKTEFENLSKISAVLHIPIEKLTTLADEHSISIIAPNENHITRNSVTIFLDNYQRNLDEESNIEDWIDGEILEELFSCVRNLKKNNLGAYRAKF